MSGLTINMHHGLIINLLLIDIDRGDGGDLRRVLRLMENNLEPEPVEDLKATDQGEACEESKHPSNPTHLVSKTHPRRFGNLSSDGKCQVNL